VRRFAAGALLVAASAAAVADEPIVDHQGVPCNPPESFPRVCAFLADDGEVKAARVYFKTSSQERFYWVEMRYDGVEFCGTLPRPGRRQTDVEYYVWAIDDEYTASRSDDVRMKIDDSCAYPVVDEDPERTSNVVVHATSKRQGHQINGFDRESVHRFVPGS